MYLQDSLGSREAQADHRVNQELPISETYREGLIRYSLSGESPKCLTSLHPVE
jgi:hypothetical protein